MNLEVHYRSHKIPPLGPVFPHIHSQLLLHPYRYLSIEEKQFCTAAFLDIAQAFDKVWHIGLLHKIKNNLPSPYYLLLKSYISVRYFQVNYNNAYSSY
jgi:hypothetical protein